MVMISYKSQTFLIVISHTFCDKVDTASCICMTSSCLLRSIRERSLFMYVLIVLKQSFTGSLVGAYGGKYAKITYRDCATSGTVGNPCLAKMFIAQWMTALSKTSLLCCGKHAGNWRKTQCIDSSFIQLPLDNTVGADTYTEQQAVSSSSNIWMLDDCF